VREYIRENTHSKKEHHTKRGKEEHTRNSREKITTRIPTLVHPRREKKERPMPGKNQAIVFLAKEMLEKERIVLLNFWRETIHGNSSSPTTLSFSISNS
jgi:hypothetical protein